MLRTVDIPAWVVDILEVRSVAAGISFDEALVASMDIRVADPLGETLGWAANRGVPHRRIAKMTHYSRKTVEHAAARHRKDRSNAGR